MLTSKISRRLVFSFLLLTIASLAVLGLYLINFFHTENLQKRTEELTINAKIIRTALEAEPPTAGKNSLSLKISELSQSAGLRLTYIDTAGKVLADSSESPGDLDNHLARHEIQAAFAAGFGSSIRYSDTLQENMLYVALPICQEGQRIGVIRIASSLAPIENSYRHTRQAILSALVVSALFAALLGLVLAARVIRPLRQMTHDASEITRGNLKKRLHIDTRDELEVLANTINSLTSHLAQKIEEAHSETHKLALILENMDNAVMLLNSQGSITTANREACRLFRLTPDLLHKHSINAIGSTLLSDTAKLVLQNRQPQSITFQMTIDGRRKTFTVFFAPFFQGGSDAVLSVFHDISLLQDLSDRQTKFVANAAHELATPLTSICGFAETLLDSDLTDAALNQKFLTIIYNEAQRMNRLIKDLLQLAKLDSREYRDQLQLCSTDCREVLRTAIRQLEPQARAKSQTLQLELDENDATVHANEDLLLQLILNLTENAIKYTGENGCIQLCCHTEEDTVLLSIRDNGIGIAPADLPFIFERFYRADKSRTRAFGSGGSGIGLSLVQFLVQMFGGTIRVESQLQSGTTFFLTLPRSQ